MEKKKKKIRAEIVQQECISDGIYSLWLGFEQDENIAEQAKPGQFVSMYTEHAGRLLPRPISICEIDRENARLRVVYRIAGKGTAEFATKQKGDFIDLIGPLGNGYTLTGTKAFVIGGGIGIPPLLQLSKELSLKGLEVQVVLGYRDDRLFLRDEFLPYGAVRASTEDGSVGTRGNVIDAIRENPWEADVIYACGPMPMLRGVKAYAEEKGISAQISLEERMACGIGACLACVCQTTEKDEHSQVNNARICKDGPVFDAQSIML